MGGIGVGFGWGIGFDCFVAASVYKRATPYGSYPLRLEKGCNPGYRF